MLEPFKGRKMMNSRALEANANIIKEFYAAFGEGRMSAAVEFLSTDFVMHVPGRGLNAGEYWGRDGFLTFSRNIQEYAAGPLELRLTAIAVGEQDVFTRERVRVRRRADPRREWVLAFIMHYKMKLGRISEAWTIPEDLYHYDEFWTARPTTDAAVSASPPADEPIDIAPLGAPTSEDKLLLIQAFYADFWRGNFEALRVRMTDDVVFYTAGRSALAGSYRGFDGYLAFRDKLIALGGDRYKLEIDAVAAGENAAFVKEHVRMNTKRNPRVRTVQVILQFAFRGDRIAMIRDIPLDLYAYEEFYG
jgi:ketosteroid isomerase-like protein